MNDPYIIFVAPLRSNIPVFLAEWEGQLYWAPMKWWSDVTGKTVACMSARLREYKDDRRDYTVEQVLGIDDISYRPIDNLPIEPKREKSLAEIHSEMDDPMSLFIRGKIGWNRSFRLADER